MANLFSLQEVADHLHVSRRTATRWVADGKITGTRFGSTIKVTEAALTEYMNAAGLNLDGTPYVTDRAQGVDCPLCEDSEPHTHPTGCSRCEAEQRRCPGCGRLAARSCTIPQDTLICVHCGTPPSPTP